MALDEKIFSYLYKLGQKVFGAKAKPLPPGAATLELMKARIEFFARAYSGKMIEVYEADEQPSLCGTKLFLSSHCSPTSNSEVNEACYFMSAAFACRALHMNYVLPAHASSSTRENFLNTCFEDVVAHLSVELPRLFENLAVLTQLSESAASPTNVREMIGVLPKDAISNDDSSNKPREKFTSEALARGTEIKAKAKSEVEVLTLEETQPNPATHVFEKVQTAEEYKGGGNRIRDGSDEIIDHEEALSELKIKHIIRSSERTDSLYKADISLDVNVADIEDSDTGQGKSYFYDEWNHASRKYKTDWCKVFVDKLVQTAPAVDCQKFIADTYTRQQRQIQMLKNNLQTVLTKRKMRSRQTEGTEIDLDALVDANVDLRSGRTPSDKVYRYQRRQERDIATLILIDCSLSTDSWVQNRRVLDVIKDSVFALSKVLTHFSDTLEVAAFFSQTRNECHYIELKTFAQNWKASEWRLAALSPQGYTRIGPAIRHSTMLLARQKARKKLLLLLSDGKPTDYDKYEGRYGIEDVRQAVREANQLGVRAQALAIESSAKFYLPQMFGHGRYRVLSHPDDLSENILKIYSELLR